MYKADSKIAEEFIDHQNTGNTGVCPQQQSNRALIGN